MSKSTDSPTGDRPLVTVVVTTYDRPEYLRRAVRTVEAQTYAPIELLVVDDCSPTPASETLRGVSPDVTAFEVLRHDTNRGANGARNTGVEAATGEYIAFLDDDDRWVPEKLARQVETFERAGPDVGLVYTGRKGVSGGAVHDHYVPEPVEGDMTKALLCRNEVGTQSAVMVRAAVAKATPFDEEMPGWADLEWYVTVSTKCAFELVPEAMVVYEYDAHNRISDDMEKLSEGHRVFVEKYRDLARGYGLLFERKMRGWAAYRVGSPAIRLGEYAAARQYLLRAIAFYPFEPEFYTHAAAAIGGPVTHRAARGLKRALAKTPLAVD